MKKPQTQMPAQPEENGTLLVLFNKPFEVLCQFSADGDKRTLAEFIGIPGVYAAGRLDFDSEGLLILTNHGKLQQAISDPRFKLPKTYWVQVEGEITQEAIKRLREGVSLNDGMTLPAEARRIEPPEVWERFPPIRERRNIPTSWVELVIREGRNRQVRRMTAATGFPTLRLIRAAIGEWGVADIPPGEIRVMGIEALPDAWRKVVEKAPATYSRKGHLRGKQAVNASSDRARPDRSRAHPPRHPSRSATPSSRKGPRS